MADEAQGRAGAGLDEELATRGVVRPAQRQLGGAGLMCHSAALASPRRPDGGEHAHGATDKGDGEQPRQRHGEDCRRQQR